MNSTQVAGDFSLNGGAFPVSNQNMGQIVFRDQATGIESVLAQTKDGSYDHRIVRGVYDIVYQHLIGLQVPQNKNALLGAAVIKTPANIDIDVPARLFQTAVLHNGVLFPAAQQQAANMLLRNGDSGDLAFIGKTSLQNLSALVVHGTYDVYYSHLSGTEIPQNKMARTMQGLVIAAPGPAIQGGGGPQLNVNSVVMTGQFLLNDAPMPASEYDDGLIKLRRAEDQVLLGNTHDQNYEARVVDQDDVIDFIVHYESETRSAVDLSLPFNGDAEVMCVRLEPIIF